MKLTHIRSREAYINSIKRLHAYGYIVYMKSPRRFEESRILMLPLSAEVENHPQVATENRPQLTADNLPHTGPESRPHTGQKAGHFNKQNINNFKLESVNRNALSKKNIKNEVPELEEVLTYFETSAIPISEGRKFFYHYQAVGWTRSGIPISDWQAAAQKWAENIDSFTSKKNDNGNINPGRLHVNENKRYDIPL